MHRILNNVYQNSNRLTDNPCISQGEQEFITYKSHSSIRIWSSEESFRHERHFHSAVEIVMVSKGQVTISFNNDTIPVQENQITIIPSDYPHSLCMDDNSKCLLFLFEPIMIIHMRDISCMATIWSRPVFLNEDSELRSSVSNLLLRIFHAYTIHDSMWNTMCYSDLLQIYALLGRHFLMRTSGPNNSSKIDAEIMNSAITYIRQNCMRPIDLDDVAHFVGYSRHYFSRTFKQFTGIPFSSFLTAARLDIAEEKLISSDSTVQQIAFACGFSSIATFNRVFKEYKKCTPSQYRMEYSENVCTEEQNKITE